MPVKRRADKRRLELSEIERKFLLDAIEPGEGGFAELKLSSDSYDAQFAGEPFALWEAHRDHVLAEWIAERPGTRPSLWWKHDAPRLAIGTFEGCYYDGRLPVPRLRLGGIGTPAHEVLAYVPELPFGMPEHWIDADDVALYGRKGDFAGVAIDPRDPPRYESEATYLLRLGLLLPGERRRLRLADFAPVTIEIGAG